MSRYRSRVGMADPARELAALREARRALCRVLAAYPISGSVYGATREAIEALDTVAFELSGDDQALLDEGFRVPR